MDYSFSRPRLGDLRASGIGFVARYIGPGTSQKYITRGEAEAIQAHGMAVVITYQTTERFMLGGEGAGIEAAQVAAAKADAVGQPGDRPIYFALDTDPRGLTAQQLAGVTNFLNGAAQVLGRQRVGIYGGFRAIELFCPSVAPFGWQTYAWSAGQWSGAAQFRQVQNNVPFAGGVVDFNESIADDFGQWPISNKDWFDMATRDELKQVVREVLAETVVGIKFPPRFLGQLVENGVGTGVVFAFNAVTMERMNLTGDNFAVAQYEVMGYVRPPGGDFYRIGQETIQFFREVPKKPQ